MTIKMLIFDFRDSEKKFFENNKFEDFDITFFKESLNEESVKNLTDEQLEQTAIISVFIDSEITEFVINQFKNLRTISTRSTGIDHINHKICVDKNIDVLVCVGKESHYLYEQALCGIKQCYYFENNELLSHALHDILQDHDVVLVKGSHSMNLKEIVEKI